VVQNLAFGAISASQLVHRTTIISSFQIENGELRIEKLLFNSQFSIFNSGS